MILHGIDVSSVQGKVPWQALKDAGHVFGAAKCQQGNDGKDPRFEENLAEMKRVGIIPQQYVFVYPLPHLDPVAQARGFYAASNCGENIGELPPLVDFEWPAPEEWAKWKCTPPQIGAFLKPLLEEMTRLYSCKPVVYLYPYFVKMLIAGGADLSYLSDYGLCIADYSKVPQDQTPYIPPPWSSKGWLFRQWDGNGGARMPNGVDSDFMVFNGTLEDLQALAGMLSTTTTAMQGPIVHPSTEFIDALVSDYGLSTVA